MAARGPVGFRKCIRCNQHRSYPAGFSSRTRDPERTSRVCLECAAEAKSERTRRCQVCQRVSEVPGEIKQLGRKCKRCLRESKRQQARERYAQDAELRERTRAKAKAWNAANIERHHHHQRTTYRRIQADRGRKEAERVRRRMNDRIKGIVQGKVTPRSDSVAGWKPLPVGTHSGPQLSTGPLRDWLMREFGNWEHHEIAQRCGMDGSHLTRILRGEQQAISLHTADRIFVEADCTHMLALLYPEP